MIVVVVGWSEAEWSGQRSFGDATTGIDSTWMWWGAGAGSTDATQATSISFMVSMRTAGWSWSSANGASCCVCSRTI